MPENLPFERDVRCSAHLGDVVHSTSYGTLSLRDRTKSFCRVKDKMENVLVVMVPSGLKEALIEAEPDTYCETPHYAGCPAMLVRLDAVSDEELRNRLECAWLEKASKKLATRLVH